MTTHRWVKNAKGEYVTEALGHPKLEPAAKPGVTPPKVETEATSMATLDSAASKKFGKKFNDVTTTQRQGLLEDTESVIVTNDLDYIVKNIGSVNRGIEVKSYDSKPALLYGGYTKGVVTDGFILIDDRAVANDVLGKVIAKDEKIFIKNSVAAGVNYKVAEVNAKKSTTAQVKKYKDKFPDYKALFPKERGNVAHAIGVDAKATYLTDGEHIVAIDSDKLAFMLKHLPNAEMRIIDKKSTVQFLIGGRVKGMAMPIYRKIPSEIEALVT